MVILATTDIDKLPDALISRTTVLKFSYPTPEEAAVHLVRIASAEGLQLTHEAALRIAKEKRGRPRDCLGLLYELSGYGNRIDDRLLDGLLGPLTGDEPDDGLVAY